MSTTLSTSSHTDRDARHARQGVQTGARMFGDIRIVSATCSETLAAVNETIARVDAGPAPQAFKDAVRAEMNRRYLDTYPAAQYGEPGNLLAVL